MQSEIAAARQQLKKQSAQNDVAAARKQIELLQEMEGLGLTEEEYKEFLVKRSSYRPTLYDVNKILDETVVGEYKTRMSIFVSFILAKNPTYVSGPSSAGKTSILTSCMDTVLPGDVVYIEGSSEHALLEKEHEIKKAKYAIITEFNKISSDLNREIIKSWGEGKDYAYSRSKLQGGCKEIVLKCLPYAITRADESEKTCPLGVELQSRLCELAVNSSQDQTLSVMSRQAETFEDPFTTKYVNVVDRACLRYHISNLPTFDFSVNPAGQMLKNAIPSVFSTARRQFPAFKASADGICLLNHLNRLTGQIKDKSVIFVTLEDNFQNSLIFGETLKDAALRLNDLQKTIMKIIIEHGSLNKQDIQQQLRTYSLNNTIKIIETHLDHLTNLGYLNVLLEGRNNFYSASSFYKNFDLTPDFKEMLEYTKNTMESIVHYADYCDEYIERFCDPNNLKTISPFDGSEIDILNYKWDSIFDVTEGHTRIKNTDDGVKRKPVSLTDWI